VSLRLRLTVLYVVLLALALTAFSVTAYLIANERLYHSLDDGLAVRAEVVVSDLGPLSGAVSGEEIARSRRALDSQASGGAAFQIRSADGPVLYSSFQTGDRDLPPPRTASGDEPVFFTRKVAGQQLRIIYQPIVRDGSVIGSVEVARSLKETDDALGEIRNIFIVGGLAALFLTSVPAYLVAGRALRPIRQVSQLARDIERTADFSRRLPAPGSGGETRELVATFNAMINRVEATLVAQRAFLADSSHELRRPLTVIRTNLDLLNNPALPPEEREPCLLEMRSEAEAMSRLLSDLLLLSREETQAIGRAPVDYTSLCSDAVDRLTSQDRMHEIAAQVDAEIQILGDKERLGQMLGNLLGNAAAYTPEGGRIELRLQRLNGVARVEVRDTGIGIPEDDLPHVFDRFYRGQNARAARADGTGLGLAIVKYVAEAHGGTVSAASQPGKETTFVVDLPVTDEQNGSTFIAS